MPKGTVLENLSTKKWRGIIGLIIASQIAYCLMLYFFSSALFINEGCRTQPSVVCKQNNSDSSLTANDVYDPSSGDACEPVDPSEFGNSDNITRVHIYECVKDYSYNYYWHRYFDFSQNSWRDKTLQFENLRINRTRRDVSVEPTIPVEIRLSSVPSAYYDDDDDDKSSWIFRGKYSQQQINVHLYCQPLIIFPPKDILSCDPVKIMNLGGRRWSADYYRIDVYIPDYVTGDLTLFSNRADEMTSVTMFWQGIIFFPIVLILVISLSKRLYLLSRPLTLIEKMLLTLGASLLLFDIPIFGESFFPDSPRFAYKWHKHDIAKNLFYAVLFLFSMIFICEHTIKDCTRKFSHYRWTFVPIFIMNLLWNAFTFRERFMEKGCAEGRTIWQYSYECSVTHKWWPMLVVFFLSLVCILAAQSILFVCHRMTRTFKSINEQQVALPKKMRASDNLHHAALNRFKIIMWMTLICVTFTVIDFICGRMRKGRYMWHTFGFEWPITSFLYIHFMWNIYVLSLLYLYKPSDEIAVTLGPNSTMKVRKPRFSWGKKNITHVYNIMGNEPKHPLIH